MTTNRFTKSTNIKYDFFDRSSTDGIILTNPIRELLVTIHEAITIENASKAISIIGPYGTGKSTGLLYALKYFSGLLPLDQQKQIYNSCHNSKSCGEIHKDTILPVKTIVPCILVGRRRTIGEVLSEQLLGIAKSSGLKPRQKDPIYLIEKIIPELEKKGQALLIIIDELGKFLENAVDDPSQGDVYILQEIAEYASRLDGSLIIITSRHQSFESYASTLSVAEINEWKKIQGRYYDITFQSTTKESLYFICESLIDKPAKGGARLPKYYWEYIDSNRFPCFQDFELSHMQATSILHPVVTVLLSPMFKKLAQNERSVFSFINSNEPNGIDDFLNSNKANDVYGLFDLFDYIYKNLYYAILNTSAANTWSQIESLFIKHPNLTQQQAELLKVICTLDIFRDNLQIPSTPENIAFCYRTTPAKLDQECILTDLKSLVSERLLTKNETWNTYHVWYGGSIDVEKIINENYKTQFFIEEFANVLNQNNPLPPLLAKSHYARTGTIRYFSQEYLASNFSSSDISNQLKVESNQPGSVYTICYEDLIDKEHSLEQIQDFYSKSTPPPPVIFCFLRLSTRIKKLFNYYNAVNDVRHASNEIAADEVSFQLITKLLERADGDLDNELRKLRSLNNSVDVWNPNTNIIENLNTKQFNQKLSHLFDQIYTKTPTIFNEIANRSKPSASGNLGIKELSFAMLNQHQSELGLHGGPEWGIYLSVIKRTGIHRIVDGVLGFYEPTEERLIELWGELYKLFVGSRSRRLQLLELYEIMNIPPFGIKKGLHPILALSFMLSHDGEISWYEEDDFIIDISPSIIEILLKKPELFSFRYIESSTFTEEFYRKIIDEFEIDGITRKHVSPIDILKPILTEISRMPEFTLHTSLSLNDVTRKFRKAVLEAKEPEQLLFVDIPKAFDLPIYAEMTDQQRSILISQFKSCYLNLKSAYSTLLTTLRQKLFHEFGIKDNNKSRNKLIEVISKSASSIEDVRLSPFLNRILDRAQEDDLWIENVASAVIDSPPRFWKDRDVNRFDIELKLMVNRYQLFEKSLDRDGLNKSLNRLLLSIDETERQKLFDSKNIRDEHVQRILTAILTNDDFIQLKIDEKELLISELIKTIIFETVHD